MYILSTKFPARFGLLPLFLLLACSSAQIRKIRLQVAVVIPSEYATLRLDLHENYRKLRNRIQRSPGLPRITLDLVSTQDFLDSYIRYDAVISISLYRQLASDISISNEPSLGFLELLEVPMFAKFTRPKRFIWLLFAETSVLDQYRLRYPEASYITSNTGSAAVRRIFSVSLLQFLLNLKQLYF